MVGWGGRRFQQKARAEKHAWMVGCQVGVATFSVIVGIARVWELADGFVTVPVPRLCASRASALRHDGGRGGGAGGEERGNLQFAKSFYVGQGCLARLRLVHFPHWEKVNQENAPPPPSEQGGDESQASHHQAGWADLLICRKIPAECPVPCPCPFAQQVCAAGGSFVFPSPCRGGRTRWQLPIRGPAWASLGNSPALCQTTAKLIFSQRLCFRSRSQKLMRRGQNRFSRTGGFCLCPSFGRSFVRSWRTLSPMRLCWLSGSQHLDCKKVKRRKMTVSEIGSPRNRKKESEEA